MARLSKQTPLDPWDKPPPKFVPYRAPEAPKSGQWTPRYADSPVWSVGRKAGNERSAPTVPVPEPLPMAEPEPEPEPEDFELYDDEPMVSDEDLDKLENI